jgi:hypothetical protein
MPRPAVAARRLQGWRGATVTTAETVRPKHLAGKTGTVVALNACLSGCVNPERHDEIGVKIGTRTFWFRETELRREPGLIGSEWPVSPATVPDGVREVRSA